MMLSKRNKRSKVIEEIINEIKTPDEALRFSIRQSGLTDKHIYLELGIDSGQWSRITKGYSQFPLEKLRHFTRICGNDIFLRWLAKDCGFNLRPINLEEEYEKALARAEEIKAVMREKGN